MKEITNLGAQGDVLFRRIPSIPKDVNPVPSTEGKFILAHSETGHHHYVEAVPGVGHFVGDDSLIAYLSLDFESEVIHARPFDTHETLKLQPGTYEVRRQREYTPQGFRRVED